MECNFVDWTLLSTIILCTLLSLYMVVVTSCDIMVCGKDHFLGFKQRSHNTYSAS